MAKDWPFLDAPAGAAAAILERLHANWPQSIDLAPENVGLGGRNRDFLLALTVLQDAGWVMCEAVLAGAGQEPCARDVVLTAKGRSELSIRYGGA